MIDVLLRQRVLLLRGFVRYSEQRDVVEPIAGGLPRGGSVLLRCESWTDRLVAKSRALMAEQPSFAFDAAAVARQ
jgi:hypothetical protein